MVTARDHIARGDLVGENPELLDEDGGLDGIEPAGDADAHVVVFVGPLAVNAQASNDDGKTVVVGEHRAAIAVATERLRRKEARRGGRGERADAAILI